MVSTVLIGISRVRLVKVAEGRMKNYTQIKFSIVGQCHQLFEKLSKALYTITSSS